MTPAVIAAALEAAINPMLRLDPDLSPRLAALDGKVIAIEPEASGLVFYLRFGPNGVRVSDRCSEEATVRIRGTLLALLRQWRNRGATDDGIIIEGDVAVGREFQAVPAHWDVDWEEQLSKLVGDVAAHQIGRFQRGVRDWGRQTGETLLRDGAEYLQQEAQALPPRHAVEQFLSAVDVLREDADRLAARVDRLRRRLSGDPA